MVAASIETTLDMGVVTTEHEGAVCPLFLQKMWRHRQVSF